jgi:regulatory protein
VGRASRSRFPLAEGLWHKSGVSSFAKGKRARPPLDQKRVEELALRYVERFATTRAKLRAYLARKIRERGWDGPHEPELDALADRFAQLGYVDDAAYALSKSQSLTGRGYGKRRVVQALRAAGVEEAHSESARSHADGDAVGAALRFARRRRLGPFAQGAPTDPRQREKALAAMIRAGHSFDLAKAILALEPGAPVDVEALQDRARMGTM